VLTVQEAAKRLGVSVSLVYELCSRGRITHHRLGVRKGRIRITEEALQRYLDSTIVRDGEGRDGTPPPPRNSCEQRAPFKNLDQDRLRDAWQRQDALAGSPDGRSVPKS
jgi:excisionase family DNA binding protein